jgi:CubicO group peptidase (beta-lactamase class C family)
MIMSRDRVSKQGEAEGCGPDDRIRKAAFDAGAIEAIMAQEMEETHAPGAVLAIVRAGGVLYAKGHGTAHRANGSAGSVTTDTLFRIGSVTKMFVSATAVLLDAAGALGLDRPIGALVQDLAGQRLKSTATVRLLLNHHAGLIERLTDNGPPDDGQLARQVLAYGDDMQVLPAGSAFCYSAPGYNLAGLAIERATGLPFADAVAQYLTDPLGMNRSGFRPGEVRQGDYTEGHRIGPDGAVCTQDWVDNPGDWPDGYLATSGSEMCRFLRTILGQGALDGQQLFAPEVVKTLLSPQVRLQLESNEAQDIGAGLSYGFGWFHGRYRGVRLLYHSGHITGFGAKAILVPEHDLAAFAATSQDNQHLPKTLRAVLEALLPLSPIAASRDTGI